MDNIYWIGLSDIHGRNIDRLASLPGLERARGVLLAGDIIKKDLTDAVQAIAALKKNTNHIHAVPGNCDDQSVEAYLRELGLNMHRTARQIAPGVTLIGLGGSTTTGFNTAREYSEQQYQEWLEELQLPKADQTRVILLAHNPPYDTGADRLSSGRHVGSRAVRKFIEANKPDLCLCGHLHESKYLGYLGETQLVNAGAFQDGGYCLIRLTEQGFAVELKTLD